MSNFIFNNAKGKIAYYTGLPAANDALILVPIEAVGIESDDTLKSYDDLAALLAAANNEQTTMGRKTLAGVSVTVDDANDRVDMDFTDPVWTAATGNETAALIVCYVPDVGVSTDANIIPLSKHDFSVTPNGSDVTATVAAAGYARVSEPA